MAAIRNNRRVVRFLGWCAVWWGIGSVLTLWAMYSTSRRGGGTLEWQTFALCAPLFTALAWLIGRVPVAMVRSHQRRRLYRRAERFQCLKCGYPLKDRARGGPCPECGEPLGWLP